MRDEVEGSGLDELTVDGQVVVPLLSGGQAGDEHEYDGQKPLEHVAAESITGPGRGRMRCFAIIAP